jgi:hypothetical protein
MKFNLHAIYALAKADFAGEDQFSLHLPLEIAEGVRLEDISALTSPNSFDSVRKRMGTDASEQLEGVRYALVHRFEPRFIFDQGKQELITEEMQDEASQQRVFMLVNCLRLIRPTRESAQNMHGDVRKDGSFDVMGLAHPVDLLETPENQKLFAIRDEDMQELLTLSPRFLRAMRGDYWKFRMPVQFYELGHYQQYSPKARYLLWMSAIEGLYTSNAEQGSNVAKARIRWFLGASTSVYPPGELSDLLADPRINIDGVLDDLYNMRNYIAHGDQLPDSYFTGGKRDGIAGPVNLFNVLLEAASFIIRRSLLKILKDDLLEHFKGADSAQMYFAANGFSKKAILAKLKT